jgi:sterol desaturase/sphingolipid hydroxylase (fatty acid hydroxylase superfamily)
MQLPEIVVDLIRLAARLVLVMAIFVPLERLFAARRQKILRGAFLTDLGWYFLGGVLPKLLLVVPLSIVAWAFHHAIPSAYYTAASSLPVWVRLAGALVVGEIGYYWAHRWMHEIPWMWRFHAIHHSAEEMDWLVNTRAHPVDAFFGRFCGLVPIYLLGLGQPMGNHLDPVPALFALIGGMWGFFVHANVNWRFGWFEFFVATPAFHHWHHTKDGPDVIDKNYASMLPWVDRLFGTYHLPRAQLPASYGIDDAIPADLAGQLLHPFEPPAPTATAR